MGWLTNIFKIQAVVTEEDLKARDIKIQSLEEQVNILNYKVELLLGRPIPQYDLSHLKPIQGNTDGDN